MALRRRRILFVIKNLQQGGTERQVLRMMQALDPNRFEIALCTLSPEIHYDNIPAGEPRYAFAVRGAEAVRAIRSVIADFKPDLVHSFRDKVNLWVWRALAGEPTKPVWLMSVRGRPILPLDLVWAKVMHRRAHRITVNSKGVEEALRKFARIPAERIVVVPNLIDEQAFSCSTPAERVAARDALDLPQNGFVFVLPGRISWVKNQLGLVLGLRALKRRGELPPRVMVLLAGRPRDRIPRMAVPRLIRLFGLDAQVRVLDAVKNPAVLYAAADALVLPSVAEGMPNVTLEAQLSGLPVVVTPQANRDALVVDGESGLVAAGSSPGSVAAAMAKMIALSGDERRQMGQRGRTRLLNTLASSLVAQRLVAVYDGALQSRSKNTVGVISPLRPSQAGPAEVPVQPEESDPAPLIRRPSPLLIRRR